MLHHEAKSRYTCTVQYIYCTHEAYSFVAEKNLVESVQYEKKP